MRHTLAHSSKWCLAAWRRSLWGGCSDSRTDISLVFWPVNGSGSMPFSPFDLQLGFVLTLRPAEEIKKITAERTVISCWGGICSLSCCCFFSPANPKGAAHLFHITLFAPRWDDVRLQPAEVEQISVWPHVFADCKCLNQSQIHCLLICLFFSPVFMCVVYADVVTGVTSVRQ